MILHVRDIAHPDSAAQKEDVLAVLEDLGVTDARMQSIIELRNKIDLVGLDKKSALQIQAARDGCAVALSAATGEGTDTFLEMVDARLNEGRCVLEVSIDLADGAAIAWLYRRGQVLSRRDDQCLAHIRVGLDVADAARFEHKFSSGA